ncbi:glycoside hydrolase family 43 protein [Usitatibacter palustris]|uniref:Beta-xylosidase n=1 Tax=Usitatibacter palustris TaxID=2732487 RepID=A0A6M4HA31_9PROT|nr:glycoside hydrolase family 43 protein [Usitatibacter palustris]QJR15254.1 Beta-xylosidase [Usitatibacter palustris]
MIRNPILPGFNPDPSICRVGDDYYIAVSTFEWYPGVQIHHSKDLVNWELVCRPLTRASQLDMRGNPCSCGIWAPCLSYADGQFWLVYTDVKRYDGNFKDSHNFIVTAPSITGPWSEPMFANSSGFDPSLFHDDDGKKWFVNMVWNYRTASIGGNPRTPAFDGILLQEWDAKAGKLTGPIKNIYRGTELGLVEGPHLYKRNGWYYLTTAEGGTAYNHAVTMARSRKIDGPYETHPLEHPITSKDNLDAPLQRAGHGQIVDTPDGAFYHTHLCGRPLPGTQRSPLGRETAIQKVVWKDDDWLYLESGGVVPQVEVPSPDPKVMPKPHVEIRRDFAKCKELPMEFQWLRTPYPERLFSLTGSALRLHGRESVGSWFEQSLVARRQEDFIFRAETAVTFDPVTYQQVAGLTYYYNRFKFHFVAVTWHETHGRCLTMMSCPGEYPDGRMTFPLSAPIPVPGNGPIAFAADVDRATLQFHYDAGQGWMKIGPVLDASVISDEGGRGAHGSFTGAFIGMLCFDTSGTARPADFSRFVYTPR